MQLDIDVQLHYRLEEPTDILMQIEIADLPDQQLLSSNLELGKYEHFARVLAQEGLGDRILLRMNDAFKCHYTARVSVDRPALKLANLKAVPPHLLPGDTIRYLMPSRYCPAIEFQSFAATEFGEFEGGARIAIMQDWITEKVRYVSGSSNGQTTAFDTFVQRQGVCRDFAHLMITLSRASDIPARFASVYAPGVAPPDFHAVAEVYLAGTWHLVDTSGMAEANEIARIGVGLDAAEVPFLSGFGQIKLLHQSVQTKVVVD
ncbi:transglutaminase family protein [uncultured Sneathiella sp.]|uniref:transglutaminase-like domain-containing protein n=1 Tax=uncultured Sneathiella sp. TaxID=879315 RepID=UPI0030EF8B22|tara:strand:- start:3619 stop:4401 length:783 start_codon:yes stop_codon:yes gene_type:complete